MKKLLSPSVLMFSFGVLALGFSFASFSFADMGDEDEGIPQEDNEVMNARANNVVNPSCIDNYMDWPESEEYQPDEWGLNLLASAYLEGGNIRHDIFPVRQFLDINNDGINDFLYMAKRRTVLNNEYYNYIEECLLLGTGNGWDLAHKCVIKSGHENRPTRFYGDCALIE